MRNPLIGVGIVVGFVSIALVIHFWSAIGKDPTYKPLDITIKLVTLVGVGVAVFQLFVNQRAHYFNVYRDSMKVLDEEAVRQARHWVYGIDNRNIWKKEGWLRLGAEPRPKEGAHPKEKAVCEEQKEHWTHKVLAERVAKSFDQLGLLVREGRVPIDLVARFYTTPVLRCWYLLSPYIAAVRGFRDQRGHMWEFENLALGIVVPAVKRGTGPWQGIKEHENLTSYPFHGRKLNGDLFIKERVNLLELRHIDKWDSSYSPEESLWHLNGWQQADYVINYRRKANSGPDC